MNTSDHQLLQVLIDQTNILRKEIQHSSQEMRKELQELKNLTHSFLTQTTQHSHQISVIEKRLEVLETQASVLNTRVTKFENIITTIKFTKASLWFIGTVLLAIFSQDYLKLLKVFN